mgnify:FL=1
MRALPRALVLLGALAWALAGGPASAQAPTIGGFDSENNGKPIGIEADQGVEWQQSNHVYIARGNVKVTRGDNTLYADTLYAYYSPVAGTTAAAAPVKRNKDGTPAPFTQGSTQIYRIEADGHVRFATPTETAYGDHAVYDVDQAILVLTGKDLRLVTPRDTITARDSLEWYDQKQMGIARGNAVAVREGKRIRGDVLTALLEKTANQGSHISRINANGNVLVTSQDEIARGDAGVYNLDTGIATLSGHVTLTRGDNELRGQYAVVDLNRNIGRLLSAPPDAKLVGAHPPRVEGLLVPRMRNGAPAK